MDNISETIEELKQRRLEIDNAIECLLKLKGKSLTAVSYSGQSYSKLSVYEASVLALENKSPLTTDELVEALKNSGRKANRIIVSTTLYKSVRQKKNCRIELAGRGKWKLV